MKYGEKITALRREKGWTRLELAEKVGLTERSLATIERCQAHGTIRTALDIAKVFEVSLDELFEGEKA